MPSIGELMGFDTPDGESASLDADKLMAELDAGLGRHMSATATETGEEVTPPEPIEPIEPPPADEPPPPADAAPEPVEPPPPTPGPFEGLTQADIDGLLALHRTMTTDPARRDAVLRAVRGEAEPPPVAAAPEPIEPPPPTLPADIDPDSVEARLWETQQRLDAELNQIKATQHQAEMNRVKATATEAAANAGKTFTARYGDVLTHDEIMSVAREAAARGLPAALAKAAGDQPTQAQLEEAYFRAMDMTMRSDDTRLAKVLGAADPAPPAPAKTPAADRKKKLSGVSAAASPNGAGGGRPPLENRPDGRLTEQSRMSVVQEAANALKGVRGEF